MEIKGTAVKPTLEFVKDRFGDRYEDWIKNLPDESLKILNFPISSSAWYPINESTIIPTKVLAQLFYNDPVAAAREVGRYSAEKSLTGIDKVFIRVATPKFLIGRTANIFSSYYKPSRVEYRIVSDNEAILEIFEFGKVEELMIHRIAGWIQKAFELTNRKNVRAEVASENVNGDIVYKITARWI